MNKGNLEPYGVIYKITNKINNKVYIGQTIRTFDERYNNNLEKNTHNEHLKNSINKYGMENFEIDKEFDIAYYQEELNSKEIYWINYYNSIDFKFGYNKRQGGEGGELTPDTKNKISISKNKNRDIVLTKLISKLKEGGKNKFYGFYDKYSDFYIPLDIIKNCKSKKSHLSLIIICYLYMNTNKIGYSILSFKDLTDWCGFKYTTRLKQQFIKVLLELQQDGIIEEINNIDSLNLNAIEKIKMEISIYEEYVKVNIEKINKLMQLNINEEKDKLLRFYLYLIYISNDFKNIINGQSEIQNVLGISQSTIINYLHILYDNDIIYFCDLGYIKTSLGTIRGGTCYATSQDNLEIIKDNCKYIDLDKI